MSATEDNRRDPVAEDSDTPVKKEAGVRPEPSASPANNAAQPGKSGAHGIPRWRQIEIMKERRELREMLDDIDIEDPDWDAEIFGSEQERMAYYKAAGEADEEEEDELPPDDDDEIYDDD